MLMTALEKVAQKAGQIAIASRRSLLIHLALLGLLQKFARSLAIQMLCAGLGDQL
jgi:hypothetical protein